MQQSLQPDLNEIRAVVALADTGSFIAAGHQLKKDPAVVSRRLQRLEGRLGIRLVERSTRRMELTEAGHAYLARVRPLLRELERADEEASALAYGEPNGHLRISLPGNFGRMWLAPIITEFLQSHPRVSIEVDATNRFVDLVGERYDLAIRLGNLPDSGLIVRKIADRKRILCASPSYLARRPMPVVPADLKEHPCLCFTGQDRPNRWAFGKLNQEPVEVLVSGPLAATDAELIVDAAVAGLGLLHSSDWYVARELASGRLVEVMAEWSFVDRGAVYVITPAVAGTPSKTRAFIEWIATKLARPPWQIQ